MRYYETDLRQAFGEGLVELGETDERVVVLDADLSTSTLTSLFKSRFPSRFVQCGIAEGNMFGIAAGLARQGFTVFPATFAAFASRRALDPVYMQICGNNAEVKIPGSYPGLTATECGMSHNACEDTGIFAALPNMRVADLGDNRELKSALRVFTYTKGPVYFRVPKFTAPILFDEGHVFE